MSYEIEHSSYNDPQSDEARRIGRMCAAAILRAVMDYTDWGVEAAAATPAPKRRGKRVYHRIGWERRKVEKFNALRDWFASTSKKPHSFEWMAWAAWPDGAQGRIERCRAFLLGGDFRKLGGRYRTIYLVTKVFQ